MAAYGTDDGFAAWLTEQGYTLPANAPPPAVLRARASVYVDAYEARWTGQRAGGFAQDLAWPRTGATAGCTVAVPDGIVPAAVITATYRAAWLEAGTPGILAGPTVTPGARVKREKADVIEAEYFDDGPVASGGGPRFVDSMIDGLLSRFVCDAATTGSGAFLWTIGG